MSIFFLEHRPEASFDEYESRKQEFGFAHDWYQCSSCLDVPLRRRLNYLPYFFKTGFIYPLLEWNPPPYFLSHKYTRHTSITV